MDAVSLRLGMEGVVGDLMIMGSKDVEIHQHEIGAKCGQM